MARSRSTVNRWRAASAQASVLPFPEVPPCVVSPERDSLTKQEVRTLMTVTVTGAARMQEFIISTPVVLG